MDSATGRKKFQEKYCKYSQIFPHLYFHILYIVSFLNTWAPPPPPPQHTHSLPSHELTGLVEYNSSFKTKHLWKNGHSQIKNQDSLDYSPQTSESSDKLLKCRFLHPTPKHMPIFKNRALAPKIKHLEMFSTGQVPLLRLVDYGRWLGLSKKHVSLCEKPYG